MTQTIARTTTAPNVAPTWATSHTDLEDGKTAHFGTATPVNIDGSPFEIYPAQITGQDPLLRVDTRTLTAAEVAQFIRDLTANLRLIDRTAAAHTVAQLIRDGGKAA